MEQELTTLAWVEGTGEVTLTHGPPPYLSGTGHSLERSMGLDPESKLSKSSSNCVRTLSAPRVSTAHRSRRPPLLRNRPHALPPARPRSPTPRVGRRPACLKPGHQRHGSAQCAAQPRPVARGDHRMNSRDACGWGRAARASRRVPGDQFSLQHARPVLAGAQVSLPSRVPNPAPPSSDWNPRPRSLEPQNFPSLTLTPVHFHPTPPFQPSFPHLPSFLQTP